MKHLLLAALLVGAASSSFAQGGGETNPVKVDQFIGATVLVERVTCTTAGTVKLLDGSATIAGNLRSVMIKNVDSADSIFICDETPCVNAGTGTAGAYPLAFGEVLVLDRSVRGVTYYCDTTTDDVVAAKILEAR